METSRAHVFIDGRVQGVFYRAFTREVANSLGLNGWVKNLYDGRVEALFEGKKEDIEQAINKCRKGPPGAFVKNIDVTWDEFAGTYKGFEIKYY